MIPLPLQQTESSTEKQTTDDASVLLVPPNSDGIVVDWQYHHAIQHVKDPKCFWYFSIQESMMYAAIFEIAALILKTGFDYFMDKIMRDNQNPQWFLGTLVIVHLVLIVLLYAALVLEEPVCGIIAGIITVGVMIMDVYVIVRLQFDKKISSTRLKYSTGAYSFLVIVRIAVVIILVRYILFLYRERWSRKETKETLDSIEVNRSASHRSQQKRIPPSSDAADQPVV